MNNEKLLDAVALPEMCRPIAEQNIKTAMNYIKEETDMQIDEENLLKILESNEYFQLVWSAFLSTHTMYALILMSERREQAMKRKTKLDKDMANLVDITSEMLFSLVEAYQKPKDASVN